MSETDYLRSVRDRVTYCRRELHRFTCHGTDLAEAPELQARRLRKLEADLQRAEADLELAQIALRHSASSE